MAITLVGLVFTATAQNGANVTLTFPTSQQNDVIVVIGGHPHSSAGDVVGPLSTSGWIEQYVFVTGSEVYFGIWTYKQGASPITTAVFRGTGRISEGTGYGGWVLRGVDTTTQLDVAVTSQQNANRAPDITTVTNGAWVLSCCAGAVDDATIANPTGYTNRVNDSIIETVPYAFMGSTKEIPTAGLETPGEYTSFMGSVATKLAFAAAIRPAVSSFAAFGIPL